MNGKEVRSWLSRELIGVATASEVKALLTWWLEARLGWTSTDWLLKAEEEISIDQQLQLEMDLVALKLGKPLHYVLDEAWFAGKRFLVNENVLIPRPETEELLAWVLEDWPNQSPFRVIDLGTGSGILPISLKLARPDWEIVGADISAAALTVAQKNAALHQVDINWLALDMLQDNLADQFDLIISNPPYIPDSEADTMTKQVVAFEPHLALFVPDQTPLVFYENIARLARQQAELRAVYVEMHKNKALETSALFNVNSSKKVIRKDLNGHERMLRITYTAG